MSELKPCPFCGKRNSELEAGPEHHHWPAVRCNECGALGPSISLNHDTAIEHWNTRHTVVKERTREPFEIEDTP